MKPNSGCLVLGDESGSQAGSLPSPDRVGHPLTRRPAMLHLRIDRLVLDGLPLITSDILLFQSVLETEIARFLRDHPIWIGDLHGAAWASLPADPFVLAEPPDPRLLARAAAHSLFRALGATVRRPSLPADSHG